ncbi:MAG: Acetyl esterase/lipase, partial [Actinomycetia bacterium]|nr:Acetyl esterase/lipase [Actinomycetes bacterium]
MTRTGVPYGTRRGQTADLWLPEPTQRRAARAPVVVLIHGGFWRARPGKDVMEGLAKAVTAEGWAAW